MSVLAYVIDRGALATEPAATQALAYILNSSPDIAGAFVGMLPDANIGYVPDRIEAELEYGEARPDLTIHDSDNRPRIFVENKFWAGLTPAQPVSYLETLEKLSKGHPSALMFIVPEQRMSSVWAELAERCKQAELTGDEARNEQGVIWNRIGCSIMLITSWRYVLERLLDAARAGGDENIKHDILQLQGLASREDLQAFLPLRADEATNQEMARRLINYNDLILEIIDKLEHFGVASKKGFGVGHGFYYTGRYFGVYDKFQLWLGVYLESWRDTGITPLWCDFKGKNAITADHFKTKPELVADAIFYGGGKLFAPIRLKTGVERDRIVDDAVVQIKQLADTLLEVIPDN